MDYPLVACITPSGYRPVFLKRCIEQFLAQDYENKIMVIVLTDNNYKGHIDFEWYSLLCSENPLPIQMVFDNGKIGSKRNSAVAATNAEIIVHMDDDDTYSPDWVTKSVAHLLRTNSHLTGLASAKFSDGVNAWQYIYNSGQPYVMGATMCYLRSMWERNNFGNDLPDDKRAEDAAFCTNAGIITPHFYIDSFTATIHPNNTAKKSLNNPKIYKPI